MYFLYGKTEVEYLKGKDKILGAVIDEIGHVDARQTPICFSSVVHQLSASKFQQRRRLPSGRE